jgi:hypothetical protein
MNRKIAEMTKASYGASKLRDDLTAALGTAGQVEGNVLLTLIERAEVLRRDVSSLLCAMQLDHKE